MELWILYLILLCVISALAGSTATLIHDAAMNPVDGKQIFLFRGDGVSPIWQKCGQPPPPFDTHPFRGPELVPHLRFAQKIVEEKKKDF